MTRAHRLLFPDPPRSFAGQRALKIALRAVHVLCAALLLGAYAYDAPLVVRSRALWLAAGSGVCLLVLDLWQTAAFLAQVRGLVVIGKLLGVAALPHLAHGQVVLLAAICVVSVVSSHAPARVRYFVVFGRSHIRGAESPG